MQHIAILLFGETAFGHIIMHLLNDATHHGDLNLVLSRFAYEGVEEPDDMLVELAQYVTVEGQVTLDQSDELGEYAEGSVILRVIHETELGEFLLACLCEAIDAADVTLYYAHADDPLDPTVWLNGREIPFIAMRARFGAPDGSAKLLPALPQEDEESSIDVFH